MWEIIILCYNYYKGGKLIEISAAKKTNSIDITWKLVRNTGYQMYLVINCIFARYLSDLSDIQV